MKVLLMSAAVVIGLWSSLIHQGVSDASLRQLYENHRIFELRDAVDDGLVPAFYRGIAAAAFHRDDQAERYLLTAVREGSGTETANEAREWLINIYVRRGQSAEALRAVDDALHAFPARSDLLTFRQLLVAWRRYPNQTVRSSRRKALYRILPHRAGGQEAQPLSMGRPWRANDLLPSTTTLRPLSVSATAAGVSVAAEGQSLARRVRTVILAAFVAGFPHACVVWH